jgi:hypothetical protein
MSNEEKEKNEKLVRKYVEEKITLEEIKTIFNQSIDHTMLLIFLELIEKYVVNNSKCTLHKRIQNFNSEKGKERIM